MVWRNLYSKQQSLTAFAHILQVAGIAFGGGAVGIAFGCGVRGGSAGSGTFDEKDGVTGVLGVSGVVWGVSTGMARAAGRIVGLPGVACQSVGVGRGTAGRRAGRMIGGRTTTGRRGAGDSRALGVAKAAGICLALGVGVSCSSCENRGYFAGLIGWYKVKQLLETQSSQW